MQQKDYFTLIQHTTLGKVPYAKIIFYDWSNIAD